MSREPMYPAIRHAKFLAKHLHKCGIQYIIHIALKEVGIPSARDGFLFAKNAVIMLCRNPANTLLNGVYLAVGMLREPSAGEKQVEQAIRFGVKTAWQNRCEEIWQYYFPDGTAGSDHCPSNRDFLMAIVDFVELWKGCCEEVSYEQV